MLRFFGDCRFYKGKKNTPQYIDKSPYIVGRSSEADFELRCPSISRAHCHFSKPSDTDHQDGYLIECTSANGLAVDGQQMTLGEKKLLTGSSLITLAENIHIVYQLNDSVNCSQSIEIVDVVPKMVAGKESNVQILELNQRVLQLEQEIKATTSLHNDEITAARAETTEAIQHANELKQQLITAEASSVSLSVLNEDELLKARAEIETIRRELDTLTDEGKVLQQHLSATEIQLHDARKLSEIARQELSAALNLHKEEMEKVRAGTSIEQAKIAEERKNLQEQLSANERQVNQAEKRIEDLHLELLSQRVVATKKEAENQTLRAELNTAKLEAVARETENKSLKSQIKSVKATFSSLSDDVARYKLSWEDSERKSVASEQSNAKLKNELDAAKLQLVKSTTLTKELNAAKETACADQMTEFEEFIETDLQCAICFELVIAATALNCGHTFCSKCVRDWQARSPDCPTCRVKITSMQKCKMLDSFIARAAGKLSDDFRQRRREATGGRGTDSQGQPQKKKTKRAPLRGRQINFDLPGPEPVPEAQFFVDLT